MPKKLLSIDNSFNMTNIYILITKFKCMFILNAELMKKDVNYSE